MLILKTINSYRKELLLLLFWLIINLITAGFTELYEDEAYYYMYSRFLDWGYFDHPPFIAIMVKLGYALFQNELGVRLFSVILTALSICITYLMLDKRHPILFGTIVFSVFAINLMGFMSLPDNYLLFFAALFFYIYKKYLEEDNWKLIILLAFVMAAMMYSKYHGILVIGFTFLSNLKALLKKKTFYISILLSIVLFIPHIFWQIQNEIPSLKYHMVDRNSMFDMMRPLEYLITQILFFGPLVGLIILPVSFIYKPKNKLEKALKWNLIGVFVFFLISTLKGRVESNWTITAIIPLLYFSSLFIHSRQQLKKVFYSLAIPSILILVLLRIQIIHPVLPIENKRLARFSGQKEFTEEVMQKADSIPVLAHTFQMASILSFYSGKTVPSLTIWQRHSQYDIWKLEEPLLWKKTALVNTFNEEDIPLNGLNGEYHLTINDSLPPYRYINIHLDESDITCQTGDSIILNVNLTITQPELFVGHKTGEQLFLYAVLYAGKSLNVIDRNNIPMENKLFFNNETIKFQFKPIVASGDYRIVIYYRLRDYHVWSTGKTINVFVND